MADYKYDCAVALSGLRARFEQRAVLYPIIGAQGFSSIPGVVNTLIEQRRARISILCSRNFLPSDPLHRQYLRNCPPAFVIPTISAESQERPACGSARQCCCFWCVFCHARWAGVVWERLFGALTADVCGKAFKEVPCQLVWRKNTTWLCYADIDDCADPVAQLRSVLFSLKQGRAARARRLKPLGAAHYAVVIPTERYWRVENRAVYAYAHGEQVPTVLRTNNIERSLTDGVRIETWGEWKPNPTFNTLFRFLARLLEYPSDWLRTTQIDHFGLLLRSRGACTQGSPNGGRVITRTPRLFTTTGLFRGIST